VIACSSSDASSSSVPPDFRSVTAMWQPMSIICLSFALPRRSSNAAANV
jgi:hypothetical protein